MSDHAIEKLDSLIASLKSELASDPRFELLQNLEQARSKYGRKTSDEDAQGGTDASTARIATPIAGGRQMTPARAKAFEISREHLVGKTEPVKTKELYKIVDANGCDLPGGANNLASLLGRFPKTFKSHGRAGWTLVDHQPEGSTEEEKPEAADDLISRSTSAASITSPFDQRTHLQ